MIFFGLIIFKLYWSTYIHLPSQIFCSLSVFEPLINLGNKWTKFFESCVWAFGTLIFIVIRDIDLSLFFGFFWAHRVVLFWITRKAHYPHHYFFKSLLLAELENNFYCSVQLLYSCDVISRWTFQISWHKSLEHRLWKFRSRHLHSSCLEALIPIWKSQIEEFPVVNNLFSSCSLDI